MASPEYTARDNIEEGTPFPEGETPQAVARLAIVSSIESGSDEQNGRSQYEASDRLDPGTFMDANRQLTPRQLEMFSRFYTMPEHIARKVTGGSGGPEALEEALAAGYLGLVKAITRYDRAKVSELAVTGSDYIYQKIWGEIMRNIRDRSHLRALDDDGKPIRKPSVIDGTVDSLDRQVGYENNAPFLIDTVVGDEPLPEELTANADFDRELVGSILTIIKGYPKREREIFLRCGVFKRSQTETAKAVGLSQMHVSRLMRRMIKDVSEKLGPIEGYEPIQPRPTRRSKKVSTDQGAGLEL